MGTPRFKPAKVFSNPRDFARNPHPTWANPNPLTTTETAWAIYQHRAAQAVLEELRTTSDNIANLAKQLGEDPAWLQRKLHGQTPADIGDIMAWTLHYGIHILPIFDTSSELRPE